MLPTSIQSCLMHVQQYLFCLVLTKGKIWSLLVFPISSSGSSLLHLLNPHDPVVTPYVFITSHFGQVFWLATSEVLDTNSKNVTDSRHLYAGVFTRSWICLSRTTLLHKMLAPCHYYRQRAAE